MDINQAIATVKKLHEERKAFGKKKEKAKRNALISVVIGGIFLIGFIITLVLTLNNHSFEAGTVLFIMFAIFAFIFLEAAIVFFLFAKCVYGYQEENRKKLLEYIEKEVNKKPNNDTNK